MRIDFLYGCSKLNNEREFFILVHNMVTQDCEINWSSESSVLNKTWLLKEVCQVSYCRS